MQKLDTSYLSRYTVPRETYLLAELRKEMLGFNPQAKTNWDRIIPQMYTSHESEKKTEYIPRVLQVEKATFAPTVFSTSGGIGKEADKLIRRMAGRMSAKKGETYSSAHYTV